MFSTNQSGHIRMIFINELEKLYDSREAENITFLVFQHFKNWNRFQLKENENTGLSESELLKFHFALKELKTGKPLQYVLGETEFYGLKFFVNESVLIPRPETEELVHLVINDCKKNHLSSPVILDIGTGSGCIPAALKKNIPDSVVMATDVSEASLVVAKKNAEINGVEIQFFHHDILSGKDVMEGKADIIISNPPYIPEKEKNILHKNVVDFEPHIALFSPDNEPLKFYIAISLFAKEKLKRNGKLFFEVHENFAKDVKQLMEENGFGEVEVVKDMQEKERMVFGVLH